MTVSKEEHSFPYDVIAVTGAKKYPIMIRLIKDAPSFAKKIQDLTHPGYPGLTKWIIHSQMSQ